MKFFILLVQATLITCKLGCAIKSLHFKVGQRSLKAAMCKCVREVTVMYLTVTVSLVAQFLHTITCLPMITRINTFAQYSNVLPLMRYTVTFQTLENFYLWFIVLHVEK